MKIKPEINGRRVKSLSMGLPPNDVFYNFDKPKLVAVIVNTFHGDHDLDWIVVMEDGKETRRIGVNQNCDIEWWPDAKEAPDAE